MIKIEIKNMVCQRCIMRVQDDLAALGIAYGRVDLGSADILQLLTLEDFLALDLRLRISGLELIIDKDIALVERIKRGVIDLIDRSEDLPAIKISTHLSLTLGDSYDHLSHIFTKVTHTTIRHFMVTSRVEKVKELLLSKTLSLKEIAYRLHYSSEAHLSTQFKAITGLSPSKFFTLKEDPSIKIKLTRNVQTKVRIV